MTNTNPQKLGLTFHRTFPLSRDRIRQVLEVAQRHGTFTLNDVRAETSLGTIQVECDPRYASGVGFINENNSLTEFGQVVMDHDPDMHQSSTQWLMHYYMAAPHYRGPAYWGHLTSYLSQVGNTIQSEWLARELGVFLEESESRSIEGDTLRKTATAFAGTYGNSDGLGALNLLRKQDDVYQVGLPEPISIRAFAYVLADFWAAQWGDAQAVSLNRITGETGPGPLLLLGSGEMNELLGEMHTEGLIRVERGVRPYTVFRRWSRPEEMRERLYA